MAKDTGTTPAKIIAPRKIKITPAPVGKISEAGVYDIPMERYHSDCCVGPSVSSSGLRILADPDKSPAHFWDKSYLNPKRDPKEDEKDYFTFGQAAHILLLGESGFTKKFVLRPEDAPDGTGRKWNGNNNACKEWDAAQAKDGKRVLTITDIENIRGMANSLRHDPFIQSGILSGEIERSLIWQDKETGIWLKVRPDALPIHAELAGDVKTTADASKRACDRAIFDFGYHEQLALIGEGIKAVLGWDIFKVPDAFALIFIEKTRPWPINVRMVDDNSIHFGRMENRRALRKMADCLAKNDWPGYETSGGYSGLPDWRIKQLEAEIKGGFLAELPKEA